MNGERTQTSADGTTLSAQEDCIEITAQLPEGQPGTHVIATISKPNTIRVTEATAYITEFVRHVPIPVTVNGTLVSQQPLDSHQPPPPPVWSSAGSVRLVGRLSAAVCAQAGADGQLWIDVTEFYEGDTKLEARLVLSQGAGQIQTFRSGFGLATVGVASVYGFGGAINMPMLQPTAGREALSTASMTFLQGIVRIIESWVSERFATHPVADKNTRFIEWARLNGRPDLCGQLQLRQAPSDERITLEEVRNRTVHHPMRFYAGRDALVVHAVASEESPLLVGSQRNPRRACERGFLNKYCNIELDG